MVVTSVKVISTKAVQLSKAVTLAVSGIEVHSTVTSFGTFPKTGLTVSINVITWVPTTSLLHKSIAVQVRVIVYGQPVPTTSLKVTGKTPAQSSIAVTNASPKISSQLTVISEGTPVKTGRLLSSTVITCVSVIVLLQESVAVHVRVIVYGQPVDVFSEKTTATSGVQLSLAVTIAAAGIEAQSTVTSFGIFAKTGASLSSTVIIWVPVTTLLQESLAVQVRVIVYGQPVEMFSAKTTTTFGVQLSLAVTLAAVGIDSQSTVISFGTFAKIGKVLSSTVITWITESTFPQSSIATHFRVIKYGQPFPISSEKTMSTTASQLSSAVTFAAVGMEVHSTVTSDGTFAKVGSDKSWIWIFWVKETSLSQSSANVQVLVIV